MINYDSLTLKQFLEENKEFFIGAKLQKIQQPNRNELIFVLRKSGEAKKLYVNFNPNFFHICFMSEENELKRNITIPKTAPMFCMLLRKYIQNSKITDVQVPEYERIFEIYFDYYDELGEKSQLCLAVELMGKYSNVILYNYDTNVIIGCAHNVSAEKSRERELYGMLPYIYPPKQKKKNILRVSQDSFINNIDKNCPAKSISSMYNYITIPIAEEFLKMSDSFEDLYYKLKDFLSKKHYSGYISNDFSKFFLFKFENSFKCANINQMTDDYFSICQSETIKKNLKLKIIKQIQNQLDKLNNLKIKQEQQIQKTEKSLEYKNKADIIMANLYYLKAGVKIAELKDFEGNNTKIELDENLSATENANKYYSLYKKIKTAAEYANTMLDETNSQILYFEEMKFYTQNAQSITELNDIWAELNNEEQKISSTQEHTDYINFQNVRIYIGKNKKQNDYILSKIASPEDLWFHPLNAPGAHILVKTDKIKNEIPDEILLKAAELTKEYSAQKNNSKTSVIYTKRKYVKKANNKLAFVTYKNEKEIVI